MQSKLTAAPTLVGSPEDLWRFHESLEKVARSARQFSKPLEQFARVSRQVCNEDTRREWAIVKPKYEAAPPHEKRRLGNMTIGQAFAFYARKASASGRVSNFRGGRVPAATRARRRSIHSSRAKARAPGSSSDDEPEPLNALPSSLAFAGPFCVPARAFGSSPPGPLALGGRGPER
jgi:hypothetical protein